jgi:hypothetical protein
MDPTRSVANSDESFLMRLFRTPQFKDVLKGFEQQIAFWTGNECAENTF